MAQTTRKRLRVVSKGPFVSSSGCGDTEIDAFLGTALTFTRKFTQVQSPNHVTNHVELLFRTPTSKLVRLSSTTTNHPYSPLLGVTGPQDMSHQETWVDLESPSTLNFGVQRGFGVSRWGSRRVRLEPWVSFFSFDITLLTMTCRWTATSTRKATTSKPPPNKDMDEDNRGLRRRCVLSLG